jgi:hypothetical protein
VIGQGEVLIDGTEMSLISLANVLAERIGHTEAGCNSIETGSLCSKDGTLPNVHVSRYIFNFDALRKREKVFKMLDI